MDAETAYLFRHALYRDAAYQLQPPAQRAALHGMALDLLTALLETPPLSGLRGAMAEELADHARAAREVEPVGARRDSLAIAEASHLLSAAQHVERRYQFDQAVRLALRGLDLPGIDPQLRMKLHELAADCQGVLGRFDASLAQFAGLRQEALKVGDEFAAARCLIGESIALFRSGRFAESEQAAQRCLEESERRGDLRLQSSAWQCLGKVYDHTRGAGDALAATRRSLDLIDGAVGVTNADGVKIDLALRLANVGRRSESDEVLRSLRATPAVTNSLPRLSRVLSIEASNAIGAGDLARGLQLLAESTAAAKQIGAMDIMANNEMARGMYLGNAGRRDEALAAYLVAEAIYHEVGAMAGLSSLHNNRASLLVGTGRFDEAEREMDSADRLNRRLNRPLGLTIGKMNRAELAAKRDQPEKAASLFEQSAAEFETLGRPQLAAHALAQAGQASLGAGQPASALQLARKAEVLLASAEAAPETIVDCGALLALALAACGQHPQARQAAKTLLASSQFSKLPEELREPIRSKLALLA